MTSPLNFDALLYAAEQAVRLRKVPQRIYRPPATADNPAPDPIVTPEHTIIETDPDKLPRDAVTPDGGIDLAQQVALNQEALRRLGLMQLRSVHGAATLTVTITINPGQTRDVPLTWETAPLASCRHAVARLDVGVAWLGKISAAVVPGSVTDAGCTVRLTAASLVVITSAQPLTVHADGTYLYWPPFEGPR